MIKELVGGDTTVDIGALPYRKGECMECYCNNEKLKKLTGWCPRVTLEEGLRMTVAWYKDYYKIS
jgi:UDP-glucuronate 4-epimerase